MLISILLLIWRVVFPSLRIPYNIRLFVEHSFPNLCQSAHSLLIKYTRYDISSTTAEERHRVNNNAGTLSVFSQRSEVCSICSGTENFFFYFLEIIFIVLLCVAPFSGCYPILKAAYETRAAELLAASSGSKRRIFSLYYT